MSVSARCSKTRKPLRRGPQNKALQRQQERLGSEAPSTTTSVLGRLGGPKRVRLSEDYGVEVVGGKVLPWHNPPSSFTARATTHAKGLAVEQRRRLAEGLMEDSMLIQCSQFRITDKAR